MNFFEQPDPIHVLHAQVGDHEIRSKPRQGRQRFRRALDGHDFVTFGAEPNAQKAQQSRVVIDEQDTPARTLLGSGHALKGRLWHRLFL